MRNERKYAVILASGGIDSTACINYYKALDFNVLLTFFDYGQVAKAREYKAVSNISRHYEVPLQKITVKHLRQFTDGLVLGRNAAFYFLALMNFNNQVGVISSGLHYGTNYYDCSQGFLDQMNRMLNQYSQGTIIAEAPFINFNKKDIIDYCALNDIPLHLTYSCELGKKQPCGICATCKDLISIYALKKY